MHTTSRVPIRSPINLTSDVNSTPILLGHLDTKKAARESGMAGWNLGLFTHTQLVSRLTKDTTVLLDCLRFLFSAHRPGHNSENRSTIGKTSQAFTALVLSPSFKTIKHRYHAFFRQRLKEKKTIKYYKPNQES